MSAPSLTFRAGPTAFALIRDRGLRAEDVDMMLGASGGARWLALAGLDRFLFGEFLAASRSRPMHLIGSSIGSWRMACMAQRDPLAALARGHGAYIYDQRYSRKPPAREVTTVLTRTLDALLGPAGVDEILAHRWARLHVITSEGRGLAGSHRRPLLMAAVALSMTGNLLRRRTLALQWRRFIFHNAGDESPLRSLQDMPTRHVALSRANVRAALLASGAIPLLVDGVRMPGLASGMHWDGGVLDYHLDLDVGAGAGLVLYPHFYSHVVPGWFDKRLPHRRADGRNFARALLIAPSEEFVATLPNGRIPDRSDFVAFSDAERVRRWERVTTASERLGNELRELLATGRLIDRVRPW